MKSGLLIGAITLILLTGCEKKPALIQGQTDVDTSVSYVAITPSFGGFTGPEDIIVGNDQLLYVADTKANRVVMMNRAGQILSTRRILQPVSLAQDTKLDLLVGGSIIAANGDTVGAIFRIRLVHQSSDTAHRLDLARMDTVWRELARPRRRFPGITVFGDNSYLVVRTGPDNSSFVDPDARVMEFNKNDNFITPVPAFTSTTGGSITNINRPTGIASFPGVKDFILTQSSEGVAFAAVWMRFENTVDFTGWLLRYDPANLDHRGIGFIRPNRFLQPEGVAIDPVRRDIFIADAGLDSVFKFNNRGAFKNESFGIVKSGGRMKRPTGVAFFERMLYVLDGDTGQILRFRLTTDVPR